MTHHDKLWLTIVQRQGILLDPGELPVIGWAGRAALMLMSLPCNLRNDVLLHEKGVLEDISPVAGN